MMFTRKPYLFARHQEVCASRRIARLAISMLTRTDRGTRSNCAFTHVRTPGSGVT